MINKPIVVEIGCGNAPGPFFEGAAEHYAVDRNGPAMLEVLFDHPEMTPMVADASELEFDDGSVDIVLARDVFGDIAIGMNNAERYMQVGILTTLARDRNMDEFFKTLAAVDEQSDSRKIAIMREVSRILTVGGKLIAVEQETPHRAEEFFNRARQRTDFDLLELFEIEHNVPLADVTPPSYARVHGAHPELQTWVATRKSGEPEHA